MSSSQFPMEPVEADAGTTRSVVFVELPTYENMLPLASGYMQAYAQSDPLLHGAYAFQIHSSPVTMEREKIFAELIAKRADIYAFSCYIWNMKLVKWLLKELTDALPDSHFLLGGPQVMNHAERYIPATARNTYVCNGEGERTFREFLRQVRTGHPDLRQVPGLSFRDGDDFVVTPNAPRIQNLMEMPSPFLNGVFDGQDYSFAIMETNRGCPFRCGFCYWGAATNDKVHKFEAERIKEELTWISAHSFSGLFIADANWGLSPRDVELSEHIVRCSEDTGYPLVVHMAAAKNKPERMAEITETFVRGGLMVTQPISLQTLNPLTLELVDRKNIREKTYIALQRTLREKRISSYVELIWPLPGETYETFKDGLTKLCRSYADTIIVYPQLLLHNTPMFGQQELFGIQTEEVPSDVAEAEVVVGTKWVSKEDCRAGYWLNYALHTLYNMRALFLLSGYLDSTGTITYGDLFSDVADYFRSRTDSEICRFFTRSVADLANYDLLNSGKTAHMTLSSHRAEFDRLLADYARQQPWWQDPFAREALELDLLARPYIYRERIRVPDHPFTETRVHDLDDEQSVLVDVSADMCRYLREREILTGIPLPDTGATVRIDHRARQKMPYMAQRSLEHNANYCQGMVLRFREVLPNWQLLASPTRSFRQAT
ncbi:cobalamin-dependent protein [Streptomyces sp. NPDC006265]|uniref:B12-binding domain-containing radical SAM protein n=1 Tax=Streptomyces sp. NPDC006265 TaxID=3156740 RepID=UPI0033B1A016